MSAVARDGASEEGMSSPKRMRNESDDETSTASDEDVSSSSGDGISSEEAVDLNEAKVPKRCTTLTWRRIPGE